MGMKMGWRLGTGNHEGCPYDWFVGAYFQRNDDSSWDDDEIPMIVSSA